MMKNKKEHKTIFPELRFPKFQDGEGWIPNKIDHVCKIGNGRDYKHLDTGEIPVYGSGGYMTSVDNYLYDGDSVCIGRKGTIDKPMFITGKFWTVDTLFYTYSFRKCLPKFLYLLFQQINWYKYNEAGGVPSLSKTTIGNINIFTPYDESEQKKIVDCFSSLDDLISAVTDKIEALKEHKKGLMQRLFPTEGSAVPTLRFPEFQSAPEWEETTLSGVCDKIGDGLHGTPEYDENGEYYFVNGNNIKEGKLTLNGGTKMVSEYIANQNEKQISHKTVLMSINGTIGNVALYNYEKIMLSKSVAYLTVDTANECFVFYYLQTKTVQQQFCNSLTGSTIKNLGLEGIRNTLIYIPSPEEQKKIADCLTTIDNLIITQSDRLKQLKAHKKGLMQRLFPKI